MRIGGCTLVIGVEMHEEQRMHPGGQEMHPGEQEIHPKEQRIHPEGQEMQPGEQWILVGYGKNTSSDSMIQWKNA